METYMAVGGEWHGNTGLNRTMQYGNGVTQEVPGLKGKNV